MTWIEVGDDIFCIRYGPLDQTIGAIRTDEGLVAIDSRSHRVHAEELLADLRRLDPSPPAVLVNTHYHWDHTFGNAQFAGALLVGHRKTRDTLIADGAAMKSDLAQAGWLPPDFAALIAEVEITPPTVVFDSSISLSLGTREIDLTYLGRAHTDSDIVVTIDGVLFVGDLIEVGAPPSFGDSFPAEWPETLDRVLELCTGPAVPGHGDIVDRNFVEAQRAEIARAVSGEPVYPAEVMETIAARLTETGPK